jgi:4-hydroxy-tetrahydrodipicolinate reductase
MARAVAALAEAEGDLRIVAGVDAQAPSLAMAFPVYGKLADAQEDAGLIMDFSRPDALTGVLEYAARRRLPLVLGTTGFSNAQLHQIAEAARETAIFQSANLSLGVSLLTELVARAAAALPGCDVEIVEAHHRMKADAPSGTALALAHTVSEAAGRPLPFRYGRAPKDPPRQPGEIGLHAVRGGTSAGEHTVRFLMDDEELELRHRAESREVFARGALRAARFMAGKPPGLYGMRHLLGLAVDVEGEV